MASSSDRRFDRISRLMAQHAPTTRRTAMKASAAGIAAVALGQGIAHAEGGTPAASPVAGGDESASFLFVQSAASGSFTPNPDAATPTAGGTSAPYTLVLEGHTGGTIYFSDRPERIFGQAPTDQFITGLGFTPKNPPNAAIVTETDNGDDVLIVELFDPAYDPETGALAYGANVLGTYTGEGLAFQANQQQDVALPATLGPVSVFLDDCPDLTTCLRPIGLDMPPEDVGPLPGAPYGQCWHWGDFSCEPCDGQPSSAFDTLCNQTFSTCNNECYAA